MRVKHVRMEGNGDLDFVAGEQQQGFEAMGAEGEVVAE